MSHHRPSWIGCRETMTDRQVLTRFSTGRVNAWILDTQRGHLD